MQSIRELKIYSRNKVPKWYLKCAINYLNQFPFTITIQISFRVMIIIDLPTNLFHLKQAPNSDKATHN